MTGTGPALSRQRRHAPKADGAALLDPPLNRAASLLQANRAILRSGENRLFGNSLAERAATARRELLQLARAYTSEYRTVAAASDRDNDAPLILAGHQPQLYHPGVWFKSFVLSALGRNHAGHAINLLADNDAIRAATIRVPTGSPAAPTLAQVPFDQPADEMPYEERGILDQACFDSFGQRAEDTIAPLVAGPLIHELWPLAREAAARTGNLGRALAEGRHRFEERLGLETLELPFSSAFETDTFRWFAAGMLADLPKLHGVYNSALAEFRRVNKIRSRSHPVPDLAVEGDYLEAPFWLWSQQDPRRRRMFARRAGTHVEVTDRAQLRFNIPLTGDSWEEPAVQALSAASARGIRLRPRALFTTMYARLFLSDLFVHGIGGGKYDELTDAIIIRCLQISPPAFVVATATVRLPVDRPNVSFDDLRGLDHTLRELRYHPERFVTAETSEVSELLAGKKAWLKTEPPRGMRRERHRGIEKANLALQPLVEPQRQNLLRKKDEMEAGLRTAGLLGSREFSYCLFPAEQLAETLKKCAEAL